MDNSEDQQEETLEQPHSSKSEKCETSNSKNLSTTHIQDTSYQFETYDETRTFSEQLLLQGGNRAIFSFEFAEQVAKKTMENIEAGLKKANVLEDLKSPDQEELSETKKVPLGLHETPSAENIVISEQKRDGRSSERKRSGEKSVPSVIPLPNLHWGDSKTVWQNMVYREEATARMRVSRLFEDRSSGMARMRSILVDWIMEVCDVYSLRRTTYYLTVDYIDRYLTINPTLPRTKLQLIGVTSLFIASKFEEIFPPKLFEFAYVCDGACTEEHILKCEMLLLNTFGWDVNTVTPISWLTLYLQIYAQQQREKNDENYKPNNQKDQLIYPHYSAYEFVRAAHVIDLFSLDPGFLRYRYSIISASAMYFLFGKTVALSVSNLTWDKMEECVEYMSVFYNVIRDTDDPKLHCIANHVDEVIKESSDGSPIKRVPVVPESEKHTLQTHIVNLEYFERSTLLRLDQLGIKTEKVTMKKVKTETGEVQLLPYSEDEDEDKDDDSDVIMIMFQISQHEGDVDLNSKYRKKMLKKCQYLLANQQMHNYFKVNSQYSYDEILLGINDSTNVRNLPEKFSRRYGFDE